MYHLQSKHKWIIVSLMPPRQINNIGTQWKRARWASLGRLQEFQVRRDRIQTDGEWEVAVTQEPAGGVIRWELTWKKYTRRLGQFFEEILESQLMPLSLTAFITIIWVLVFLSYWTQVSWGLVLFPCLGIQENLWSTVEKVVQVVPLKSVARTLPAAGPILLPEWMSIIVVPVTQPQDTSWSCVCSAWHSVLHTVGSE